MRCQWKKAFDQGHKNGVVSSSPSVVECALNGVPRRQAEYWESGEVVVDDEEEAQSQ